jgi:hypothetical protein
MEGGHCIKLEVRWLKLRDFLTLGGVVSKQVEVHRSFVKFFLNIFNKFSLI